MDDLGDMMAALTGVADPVVDRVTGFKDRFNTPLNPLQQMLFEMQQRGLTHRDSGEDYDNQGQFLAGIQPDPLTGHGPDTFKKPNEPTFSDQSQYSAGPYRGGEWVQGGFIPSQTNMDLMSQGERQGRWNDEQPSDLTLAMPRRAAPLPAPFFDRTHIGNTMPPKPVNQRAEEFKARQYEATPMALGPDNILRMLALSLMNDNPDSNQRLPAQPQADFALTTKPDTGIGYEYRTEQPLSYGRGFAPASKSPSARNKTRYRT